MSAHLEVDHLTIQYVHGRQAVSAVRDVSLSLRAGETLSLVGESGCGKSTLALALIGLLPKEESLIAQGEITFKGKKLLAQSKEEWRKIRGRKIAMIFQDPFSALNPVLTIETQLQESIVLDQGKPNLNRAKELLERVQLPDPGRILKSYPHQISGGQRQRVLIAIALARNPEILIADEPTTALDVTVQDEIVKLLIQIQKTTKMALIFSTHNIGLVKFLSERIAVMYAGQMVEAGRTTDVLSDPQHPYTKELLNCLPSLKPHQGPLAVLQGQPPDPLNIPIGCPFHPRCAKTFAPCLTEDPRERIVEGRHLRCHLYPS